MVDPGLFGFEGLSFVWCCINHFDQRSQVACAQLVNPAEFLLCSAFTSHVSSKSPFYRLRGDTDISDLVEDRTNKAVNLVRYRVGTRLAKARKVKMLLTIAPYPQMPICPKLLTTRTPLIRLNGKFQCTRLSRLLACHPFRFLLSFPLPLFFLPSSHMFFLTTFASCEILFVAINAYLYALVGIVLLRATVEALDILFFLALFTDFCFGHSVPSPITPRIMRAESVPVAGGRYTFKRCSFFPSKK